LLYDFLLCKGQEKRGKLNISLRIGTYLFLEIALGQYLHKDSYTWQYNDDSIFLLIIKLPRHLKPPTILSRKFWYPNLVGSFMVSQQVFWYLNDTQTIIRWTNHLYSASVILGSQKRYTIIDNLMNENLSFRTILTKMIFVMASVASLMLDSTCSIIWLLLGTFILAHVIVNCHFEAFIVLSRNSRIFVETRYSGLPNRTVRFWQTCFDASSFR
jgi:hypothetical protein